LSFLIKIEKMNAVRGMIITQPIQGSNTGKIVWKKELEFSIFLSEY
jgi:hypothetical protein